MQLEVIRLVLFESLYTSSNKSCLPAKNVALFLIVSVDNGLKNTFWLLFPRYCNLQMLLLSALYDTLNFYNVLMDER